MIHGECSGTPAVGGGFSIRAGPNDGVMLAPLNTIEPDIDDKSPRESLTTRDWAETIATRLQRDNFNLPWAIYVRAKTGHETPGNVKRL